MGQQPDGVNQVGKDGRVRLPPELTDKYRGEYVAIVERTTGEIFLEVVSADGRP
jgi:hypothetical protein